MAGFLKVLFRNLLEGPSTDPFPLGETFTPERVRGRVVINPDLCVGCGICKHSCASGAIDITKKADQSGYTITIWRNSCCLCASCRHYCPTGAISVIPDWHSAHPESEKFECLEQHTINYTPCAHCGTLIRPLPLNLARKVYAKHPEIDPDKMRHLCPKCRQLLDAKHNEEVGGSTVAENQQAVEAASSGETINMDSRKTETVANESPEKSSVQEKQ